MIVKKDKAPTIVAPPAVVVVVGSEQYYQDALPPKRPSVPRGHSAALLKERLRKEQVSVGSSMYLVSMDDSLIVRYLYA